jgi:hypothetical protein
MPTFYSSVPVKTAPYKSATDGQGSVPVSYDMFLYAGSSQGGITPTGNVAEYKLTIKLRLKLRQVPPNPLFLDSDGKPFWTSPWSAADWQRFIGRATTQADMWNNKFWLQAPPTPIFVPEYDILVRERPNQAFRPNIRCALEVDFDPADSVAHQIIDVANIRLAGRSANAGTFRSHSLLWDSQDGIPWLFPLGTGFGQPTPSAQHPVTHPMIAHEIGHLIGLKHIGTVLKTPLCEFAQTLDEAGHAFGEFKGGRNSDVCYGQGQAIVGNIMGSGADFTVDNAWPWIWSIGSLFPKTMGFGWRAVMRDPGPGAWIRLTS